MSIFPEQPFDEREERYMLAEILKDSPIPPGNLLRVIQGEGIRPRWTEIALPNGRSVSACQKAFDNLYARIFQIPLQSWGPAPQPSPSTKARKRPVPIAETPGGLNRELQPRTQAFVTVNEPLESPAYPPGLLDSAEQRRKKRGRPSKAEVEVKAAEYAARGEPYPPPRRSKNPKPSSEGTASLGPSITFTPVTMGPSGAEGSSSGKKRAARIKPQQDDPFSGHGVVGSSAPQAHGHAEVENHQQEQAPSFQTAPPGTSGPSVASVAITAEDPPPTPIYAPGPYRAEDGFETSPLEAVPSREAADVVRDYGTGNDTLSISSTVHQQPTAEHEPPNVMHSPKQP
ncbi:MAG: hypothetical protein Q9177_005440 [Variospora cf. flavescens]